MESSLQGVMLFHNYQATRPYLPAPVLSTVTAAVPMQDAPPGQPQPAPAPAPAPAPKPEKD